MTDRDPLFLVAIAGVISGAAAASVNIAARFTSDPSDVLGFTGGIIGAGLAVLGAIFVEHWKGSRGAKASDAAIGEALVAVIAATTVTATAEPDFAWAALLTVRQNLDGFHALSRNSTVQHARWNAKFATLNDWLPRWRNAIDELLAQIENSDAPSSDTLASVNVTVKKICSTTRWVVGPPTDWPAHIRPMIVDANAHADQAFPDAIIPGFPKKDIAQ